MSKSILDIEGLLIPISAHCPAGDNLEYDTTYDEIRLTRESDPDYLPQDDWSTTLKKADWLKVLTLSKTFIRKRSKDLQVACWLAEALTHQYGIEGMLNGFRFLNRFIGQYWYTCWPTLDDDGILVRKAKLEGLDRQLSQILYQLPILTYTESTLDHWQKVLAFEHHSTLYAENKKDLQPHNDLSMENFNRWAKNVTSAQLTHAHEVLTQCTIELKALNQSCIDLPNIRGVGVFIKTDQLISELIDFLKSICNRITPEYEGTLVLNVGSDKPVDNSEQLFSHRVQKQEMSRDIAISQMLAIAHFFRQNEPSSPVPFLMERAARWSSMTLTEWLEEVLNDNNSLQDINNILKGRQ